MNVSELMTKAVQSCDTHDNLQRAAQIMWENDCGIVPVLDSEGRVVGMVTDRDVCMAAYTQGLTLAQIPVTSAMADQVHGVHEADGIEAAQALMQRARVRRVPVLNGDGRLKGILSMNDLARYVQHSTSRKANGLSSGSIAQTLAAVCEPHITRETTQKPPLAGRNPRKEA
jgi:CBS domain-containing protein